MADVFHGTVVLPWQRNGQISSNSVFLAWMSEILLEWVFFSNVLSSALFHKQKKLTGLIVNGSVICISSNYRFSCFN